MIQLKKLNADNWLEVANLSVSSRQKEIFPIPNVYWIGISRYEEHTTLFSIMLDEKNIGHRKTNFPAGKLYESLGFTITDEDDQDFFRRLLL